jgi:hypothetical protein
MSSATEKSSLSTGHQYTTISSPLVHQWCWSMFDLCVLAVSVLLPISVLELKVDSHNNSPLTSSVLMYLLLMGQLVNTFLQISNQYFQRHYLDHERWEALVWSENRLSLTFSLTALLVVLTSLGMLHVSMYIFVVAAVDAVVIAMFALWCLKTSVGSNIVRHLFELLLLILGLAIHPMVVTTLSFSCWRIEVSQWINAGINVSLLKCCDT